MAVKFSASDKDLFIQILATYPIIKNKQTDAYNIEKKKKAWEKIVLEYNVKADKQRTIVQLKRLWDKTKRNRKSMLAEERREVMATGGGAAPPPLPPQPEIDSLLSLTDYEINNPHDSDGLILNGNVADQSVIEDAIPGPSTSQLSPVTAEPTKTMPRIKSTTLGKGQKNYLKLLTEARLKLINRELEQLEELHKVRLEEAMYKRQTAKLIMMREEAINRRTDIN